MNLPDEELAKFATPGWLKRVADVPIDEVAVMVCEDPSVVTVLVGALRHARKELERLRDAAQALADSSTHCRMCQECGDGPCCANCGSEAASDRVGQLIAGAP